MQMSEVNPLIVLHQLLEEEELHIILANQNGVIHLTALRGQTAATATPLTIHSLHSTQSG